MRSQTSPLNLPIPPSIGMQKLWAHISKTDCLDASSEVGSRPAQRVAWIFSLRSSVCVVPSALEILSMEIAATPRERIAALPLAAVLSTQLSHATPVLRATSESSGPFPLPLKAKS